MAESAPLLQKHEVEQIVRHEIDSIKHGAAKKWLLDRLVEPQPLTLLFEYANDEPYQVWNIADVGERNVVIQYCPAGFGGFGSDKWGLNFRGEKYFGMDAGWYRDLESIAFECVGAPEGYEVP